MVVRVEDFLQRSDEVLNSLIILHKSGSSVDAVLESTRLYNDVQEGRRKKSHLAVKSVTSEDPLDSEGDEYATSSLNSPEDVDGDKYKKRAVTSEVCLF